MDKKYSIKNALNGDAEIDIFGDIDSWWGYNITQLREDLAKINSNQLTVNISTYGGDVFEAIAIAGILGEYDITTKGLGIVASAGTVILLKGKKRKMAANSFFMIHQPSSFAGGVAEEMRKTANILDKIEEQLVDIYVEAITLSGKLIENDREKTAEQVRKWVQDETWFSADEALQHGFIDEVIGAVEFITPKTLPIAIARRRPSVSETHPPKICNNKGTICESVKNRPICVIEASRSFR